MKAHPESQDCLLGECDECHKECVKESNKITMPTTNNILEKIREVCGLKKLEFGCEIEIKYTLINPVKVTSSVFEVGDMKEFVHYADKTGKQGVVYLKRYEASDNYIKEIIGLPVQHSHIVECLSDKANQFCAIKKRVDEKAILMIDNDQFPYDLQLTPEENLNQNPELRKLVGELILN